MTAPLVTLSRQQQGAVITLDSPANRNALSEQLLLELDTHLEAALEDEGARWVALTHTGPSFCSGADLKAPRRMEPAQAWQLMLTVVRRIWDANKPIITRIDGHVRGGGLGLVAASDLPLCSDRSTFAFSEVRVGVVPAAVSALVMPRMGFTRSLELMLTAEPFDGRRAAEARLVVASVPHSRIDETFADYAQQLTKGAPGALQLTRELVRRASVGSLSERLEHLAAISQSVFESAEAREGMEAFSEGREPSWVARRS